MKSVWPFAQTKEAAKSWKVTKLVTVYYYVIEMLGRDEPVYKSEKHGHVWQVQNRKND